MCSTSQLIVFQITFRSFCVFRFSIDFPLLWNLTEPANFARLISSIDKLALSFLHHWLGSFAGVLVNFQDALLSHFTRDSSLEFNSRVKLPLGGIALHFDGLFWHS